MAAARFMCRSCGAGYMAFIEEDGSLRPHHDIFNTFVCPLCRSQRRSSCLAHTDHEEDRCLFIAFSAASGSPLPTALDIRTWPW
jgi:hypothetical protein